jgi:A118 family predicted phage portal protein
MGILKAINPITWVNKAIDKRIQLYQKGATRQMEYNHLLTTIKAPHTNKHMTRRLLEGSVWYSGIEQDLAYFYRTEAKNFIRNNEVSESNNYFWANTKRDIRKIHTGIPQLISEKMVDLIVGNGYEIKVEGKDEVKLQEMLDEILADNKFKNLLGKSIETESWSGGVAWKLSFNPLVSDYPIIEMWQPENYTNNVISGRIVEDIFYIYYEKGASKYRLSEIYGVSTKGAYIDYKLEKLTFKTNAQDSKGEWLACELSELPETAERKRVDFIGYFNKLSGYKPNKLPNSEFRYSVLGESDYAGSYGLMDALDEIKSTWIQEMRDGKLHRYFPEEMMIKGTNAEYQYPDEFTKDHILFADSPSENTDKQKIQYAQGDIRAEKYIESWKICLADTLNNAGLSPLTVGVTGLESIASSEASQQEREKVSIRTRNKKSELWVEFLEPILTTTLDFYHMVKGMKEMPDGTFTVGRVPEAKVLVTFNDYIIKSKRDRTEEVQQGIGTSWDILTGVRYVHDDMTEREQLAISARVKLENGYNSISTAEASALQAENQDTEDEISEMGVDIIAVNENNDGTVTPQNATPSPTEQQE